jgi:hypothetical protein
MRSHMQVAIVNRTTRLLIVALNSGIALHLGPNQTSTPVDSSEIAGNEKLAKLRGRGVLTIANTQPA